MEKYCPFCDIDKEKTFILEENLKAYVAMSNPRLVKGHLLVIPKRHVETIDRLNREEWDDVTNLVVKYQKKITDSLASGYDLRQHYIPYVPQSRFKIDHVHFHLIPRNFKDEMYERMKGAYDLFEDLSDGERREVFNLLKD